MTRFPTKYFLLANLFLLLSYFIYTVYQKELILKNGTLLLLELAPVDPRSLMQGDYMALNYAFFARENNPDSLPRRGYCVVTKEKDGIAQFKRFQQSAEPLSSGEYLIRYTRPAYRVLVGAESFFFEEGSGKIYENAKYGGLKVDDKGNSLLVGLYGEGGSRLVD